jgi:hypothetical protein
VIILFVPSSHIYLHIFERQNEPYVDAKLVDYKTEQWRLLPENKTVVLYIPLIDHHLFKVDMVYYSEETFSVEYELSGQRFSNEDNYKVIPSKDYAILHFIDDKYVNLNRPHNSQFDKFCNVFCDSMIVNYPIKITASRDVLVKDIDVSMKASYGSRSYIYMIVLGIELIGLGFILLKRLGESQ